MSADPREQRLPVWAQTELTNLRRKLADAEKRAEETRLATNPAESDALLDYYDDIPIGLGKGKSVWFIVGQDQFGRDKHVYCRVERDLLLVHGSEQINVQPSSGNVVQIEVRNR